jgi:predicted polyphosphate/ATP-dependent NAD kinase
LKTELKIGLLVNPIAGMGGRVGLKGTDGVVEEAIRRGAEPVAHGRAVEFLQALAKVGDLELVVCPAQMGEEAATEAGLEFEVADVDIAEETSPTDTHACVLALSDAGVGMVVFVGGDGTARDILDAVEKNKLDELLVLGVPSGVKMYSGIFVVNPADAADVIRLAKQGTARPAEFEVMDIDEQAFRDDRFVIRLYGYLKAPAVPARFQGAKQASPETIDEHEAQEAIARNVVEQIESGGAFILGPGTTVKTVTDLLDVKKTRLGVDLFLNGEIENDVNEERILEAIEDFSDAHIVVSPIGRQGMLFGRGNQQISPGIIRRVGKDNIIVIATPAKLKGIEGESLKVDTGDSDVDDMLRGYIRVISDYNEIRLVKVE